MDLFATTLWDDKVLANIYLRLDAAGLADKVWYQSGHSLSWFLNWSHCPENGTVILARNNGTSVELCGIAWISNKQELGDTGTYKGEIGFAFLPEVSVGDAIKLGRIGLKFIAGVFNIDYLYGATPDSNKRALAYAKRMGMQMYGPIPNHCVYLGEPDALWFSYKAAADC